MSKTALSNRDRRAVRKTKPKAARHPKADGATVTSRRQVATAIDLPMDRDGLLWLIQRNRLTPVRGREAKAYRADFREAAAEGPSVKSCLDIQVRGTAKTDGHGGKVVSALDAQRRLFRKRWVYLRGQADLIEVVDGVCGRGLTLRELAGGPVNSASARAATLEALLMVALDQLAKGDVEPVDE